MLQDLLEQLLVLGTSKWAWLGVAAGLLGAWLVWLALAGVPGRAALSALAFGGLFMVCAWQELRQP